MLCTLLTPFLHLHMYTLEGMGIVLVCCSTKERLDVLTLEASIHTSWMTLHTTVTTRSEPVDGVHLPQ